MVEEQEVVYFHLLAEDHLGQVHGSLNPRRRRLKLLLHQPQQRPQ